MPVGGLFHGDERADLEREFSDFASSQTDVSILARLDPHDPAYAEFWMVQYIAGLQFRLFLIVVLIEPIRGQGGRGGSRSWSTGLLPRKR